MTPSTAAGVSSSHAIVPATWVPWDPADAAEPPNTFETTTFSVTRATLPRSVIPVIGYPEPSKHGWATSIPLSITATWTPNPAQVAGSAVEAAPAAAHPASASIVARPGSPPSMGE